jgi:TPR repeat protein
MSCSPRNPSSPALVNRIVCSDIEIIKQFQDHNLPHPNEALQNELVRTRLRVVASALTGKLVRQLSLGVGCSSTTTTSTVSTTTAPTPVTGTSTTTTYKTTSTTTTFTTTITTHYRPHFEPDRNRRACHRLMQGIVRRVSAKLMHSVAAAVGSKVGKEAEELCASGRFAAAAVALKLAVYLGHLPSRALKAWMLIDGREGVAQDYNGAFDLVEEGARLGCHHCQGVMAECYRCGYVCEEDEERSLELARESSGKGSRYGQFVLGRFYLYGAGGVAEDDAQAVALYRLAAAQGLDWAQYCLGFMYDQGVGVAQDLAEALRLYRLAAAQGHPAALCMVAVCHELGRGVRKNKAEAIRWYRRAQAAGHPRGAAAFQWLRA